MVFSGIVEKIIFRNDENGYTVLDFDAENRLITVVGIFPIVCEGESLTIVGDFKTKSHFGEQFEATEVSFNSPTDENGIIIYLSSGLFKGVGEATANAIVDVFGVHTLSIIENAPERLHEVKKISRKKAAEIGDCYKQHLSMQKTIIFLQKHGIPLGQALKIYQQYRERTIELLLENPYRLVEDIDGIGFLTADRIAAKIGVDSDSDFRIMAGIAHTLQDAASKNGHTCLPEEIVISNSKDILGVDDLSRIARCITPMIFNGKISAFKHKSENGEVTSRSLALSINYHTENAIATRLLRLIAGANIIDIDVDKEISQYEQQNDIFLHTAQKEAIVTAINNGVMVITGGPGTGKTTIIKCILEIFKARNMTVSLCAPTGRAAKRMGVATGEDASTIHRMLGMDYSSGKPVFKLNELNTMPTDVIIVDEISMADIFIFQALLKAVEIGTRIILVGDKDQLASVSAGNILSDIIQSKTMPVIYLTEIYRQDSNSLIVFNAHKINNGEMPIIDNRSCDFFVDNKADPEEIKNTVISMFAERIPKYFGISCNDIQVLSPMKKGVAGVENLNIAIQNEINPTGKEIKINNVVFRVGDKIMHIVNDYDIKWQRDIGYIEEGTGVFNGDIGYIQDITRAQEITVLFDDGKIVQYNKEHHDEIVLAYAISVHKSQGSEFPAVLLVVSGGAYMLLNRNLLYTAVTRAKNLVIIVGSYSNILKMVKNDYTAQRYTLLKELLWENTVKMRLIKQ